MRFSLYKLLAKRIILVYIFLQNYSFILSPKMVAFVCRGLMGTFWYTFFTSTQMKACATRTLWDAVLRGRWCDEQNITILVNWGMEKTKSGHALFSRLTEMFGNYRKNVFKINRFLVRASRRWLPMYRMSGQICVTWTFIINKRLNDKNDRLCMDKIQLRVKSTSLKRRQKTQWIDRQLHCKWLREMQFGRGTRCTNWLESVVGSANK